MFRPKRDRHVFRAKVGADSGVDPIIYDRIWQQINIAFHMVVAVFETLV